MEKSKADLRRQLFLYLIQTFFMSGQNHRASNDGRESTYLPISWTNQHGCGADSGPTKNVNTHCNIVIQVYVFVMKVEPLKYGHHSGRAKVSVLQGCPSYRGNLQ